MYCNGKRFYWDRSRADEARIASRNFSIAWALARSSGDLMLDNGLPYSSVGHAKWVLGAELIEYLRRTSVRRDAPTASPVSTAGAD